MAKILIVDDDEEITTLFDKFLTEEGHQVVTVNDSSRALEIADRVNPDLFLLDLMMPQPDGFKVCRMLRSNPKFSHTPVIIVTALGDTDSKVVAFGAGADDYLQKPFHITELSRKINAYL